MTYKLMNQEADRRSWLLVGGKGDEVSAMLARFATAQKIEGASVSGIGGFSEVRLGYFDPQLRDYKSIPVHEQVEVMSLLGNVSTFEGQPKVHVHAVIGRSDGAALGGHLLEARVWPTLELVVHELPQPLRRRKDAETGLPLLDPSL